MRCNFPSISTELLTDFASWDVGLVSYSDVSQQEDTKWRWQACTPMMFLSQSHLRKYEKSIIRNCDCWNHFMVHVKGKTFLASRRVKWEWEFRQAVHSSANLQKLLRSWKTDHFDQMQSSISPMKLWDSRHWFSDYWQHLYNYIWKTGNYTFHQHFPNDGKRLFQLIELEIHWEWPFQFLRGQAQVFSSLHSCLSQKTKVVSWLSYRTEKQLRLKF